MVVLVTMAGRRPMRPRPASPLYEKEPTMKILYAVAIIIATVVCVSGCPESAGSHAPTLDAGDALDACQDLSDCSHLDHGPCGMLACDRIGLVGVPKIHGVPIGCYVVVDPECNSPIRTQFPCDVASDCQHVACYSPSCESNECVLYPLGPDTPCGDNMICGEDRLCNVGG